MPHYRRPLVELRRVYRDAEWVIAGVVLDGAFHAADPSIRPASARLREAGLIRSLPLLPLIAGSEREAVAAALELARGLGYAAPADVSPRGILAGAQVYRVSAKA